MIVSDPLRFERYLLACTSARASSRRWEGFILPALLFGCAGAITWAIRGTSGWGGIDGTIVPGMTWGLLWYYYCYRIGIDARGIVFWLGMGIALGGELGYGQYVSWIRSSFHVGDEVLPIAPGYGYLWFIICGIGWGAPGGILLGWALTRNGTRGLWLGRLALLALLVAIIANLGTRLFGAGIVELVGTWFANHFPGLLFPHADLGIYGGELGTHQGRTVYTNTQNGLVLLWWVVAMGLAGFQRDRSTLVMGGIIGGGFGIGFTVSALWCLGYGYRPDFVDWWKLWELHAGFNLGVLYFIAMRWCIKEIGDNVKRSQPVQPVSTPSGHTLATFVGAALIFLSGFEYFFWTGVFLAVFYIVAMLYAQYGSGGNDAARASHLRSVSAIYSTFLLLFLLFLGGSSSTGVLLGLYGTQDVDQYDWPLARVWIFAPIAVVLVATTLRAIWHACKPAPEIDSDWDAYLPIWTIDLLGFIGVVGAASIWPAKIGVLYAIFLAILLFAMTRLNRFFDVIVRIDTKESRPTKS